MTQQNWIKLTLKSKDIFKSNKLTAKPEVMGKTHTFNFKNSEVHVTLPKAIAADDHRCWDTVFVSEKNARTNKPNCFDIHQVKVEVFTNKQISLPSKVLDVPTNAYNSISDSRIKKLNLFCKEHRNIAYWAYDYWISIVRWILDDFRIGQPIQLDHSTGWSTDMVDIDTDKKVWSQHQTLSCLIDSPRLSRFTWQKIQEKLDINATVPIHIELLYSAHYLLSCNDFRRVIIDLAVACEIYIKDTVLSRIEPHLHRKLLKDINQSGAEKFRGYFHDFLTKRKQIVFNQISGDLKLLFRIRNQWMHVGHTDHLERDNLIIDENLCQKFLKSARSLFKLKV